MKRTLCILILIICTFPLSGQIQKGIPRSNDNSVSTSITRKRTIIEIEEPKPKPKLKDFRKGLLVGVRGTKSLSSVDGWRNGWGTEIDAGYLHDYFYIGAAGTLGWYNGFLSAYDSNNKVEETSYFDDMRTLRIMVGPEICPSVKVYLLPGPIIPYIGATAGFGVSKVSYHDDMLRENWEENKNFVFGASVKGDFGVAYHFGNNLIVDLGASYKHCFYNPTLSYNSENNYEYYKYTLNGVFCLSLGISILFNQIKQTESAVIQ